MEATEIIDEADIIFSDSAASRVAQLIKEEKNPELRPVSYTHLTLPTIYSV